MPKKIKSGSSTSKRSIKKGKSGSKSKKTTATVKSKINYKLLLDISDIYASPDDAWDYLLKLEKEIESYPSEIQKEILDRLESFFYAKSGDYEWDNDDIALGHQIMDIYTKAGYPNQIMMDILIDLTTAF